MAKRTYETWKAQVDAEIKVITGGMSSEDIDDWQYFEDYEDGLSPKRSAARAVRNSKEACGF